MKNTSFSFLIPGFLKKLDHYLLTHYPRLRAMWPHYLFFYGPLGLAALAGLIAVYPLSPAHIPNLAALAVFSLAGLIGWLYTQRHRRSIGAAVPIVQCLLAFASFGFFMLTALLPACWMRLRIREQLSEEMWPRDLYSIVIDQFNNGTYTIDIQRHDTYFVLNLEQFLPLLSFVGAMYMVYQYAGGLNFLFSMLMTAAFLLLQSFLVIVFLPGFFIFLIPVVVLFGLFVKRNSGFAASRFYVIVLGAVHLLLLLLCSVLSVKFVHMWDQNNFLVLVINVLLYALVLLPLLHPLYRSHHNQPGNG